MEFPFEHNLDNVRRAVQQMKVPYPVVIDNDYSIWFAIEFLDAGVEAFSFTFG